MNESATIEQERPMTEPDASATLHAQGEDFTPLRELLPLGAPLAMSVDTSEMCNFRCQFCVYSQSRQRRLVESGGRLMEMAVFEKLVNDLKAFPQRIKKLSMHCRGEPLLHPDIAAMVRMARDADVAECIKMSTNGSLMTAGLAGALLDAGIGQLVFSIEHVTSEGYRRITGGAWSDYDRIVENFRRLREERDRGGYRNVNLCAKILDFVSDEDKEKFRADFAPYADTLLITGLYGSSRPDLVDGTMGRGQQEGFYKTGLKMDRTVCPEPFFFLCVNAQGGVMPCWMDWSNSLVLGNIVTTPLLDIWNGDAMRDFRMLHLEGGRKRNSTCKDCQFIYGIHPQSDIDDEAESLARIFSKPNRPGA